MTVLPLYYSVSVTQLSNWDSLKGLPSGNYTQFIPIEMKFMGPQSWQCCAFCPDSSSLSHHWFFFVVLVLDLHRKAFPGPQIRTFSCCCTPHFTSLYCSWIVIMCPFVWWCIWNFSFPILTIYKRMEILSIWYFAVFLSLIKWLTLG